MKIQHFMALVVLSLLTVPGARAVVQAGPLTNAANAHTYYLLSPNNWTASEAEARGLGGHLVTINDAAENQWVLNTFVPLTGVAEARLWIGLNDAANEGQFVWASDEPVTFTYWYPGEPDDLALGQSDYAAIWYSIFAPLDGRWNDISDQFVNPPALTFGVVELPTPLPVAVTQPADQIMPGGSARLNGQANPISSPALAWFEWGTSLAYGNATPPQSIGSGGNAVGFSHVLVGLVSGTEYHFRARASNAFGFAAGVDQTFNLNNQRPVVTTLAADQRSNTSARLRGQVNPRGWPTAAWFEWGTNTDYGNLIGMQDVGQGSSVSNLNVVLDGLMSEPTYHYRLVATNAFGAVYGADQTFNVGQRAAVLAGPLTNAANGHAYYLLSGNTWTASQAEARGLGGHLVTINDAAENEWVLNTFFPLAAPDASLWIGLNDTANEGQFVWISGEPVSFTYWYPGEPNDLGGEDYAAIRYFTAPAGSWWDLSGTTTAFGVVELSPPPVAVTQPADQIMPGSARLNGQADPNGLATLAWFEWGTSLAYGNATPPQSVGSSSNAVGFSTMLTGLVNGTEYHFRARASNAFGFAAGLDRTLNTQRPIVTTLAADPQTTTSAGLNGQANPSGSPTLAWFEWGTSLAYGNTTPPQSIGSGSNAVGFSNVLVDLVSNTEYHFRARASNAFGLEAGLDQTFYLSTNAPVVTWNLPINGATFLVGGTISLQARVAAAENAVSFVEFFAASSNQMISLGQVTSNFFSYYQLQWSNAPAGTFQLHAEAVDSVGLRGVSGSVQITINNPPPPPLTWTGADPSGYWSAPANWSPAGVPTNGTELVFPGGLPPEDKVSTNDLPESIFRSMRFDQTGGHTIRGNAITLTHGTLPIIHSGTNVIACDLTFSGTPSPPSSPAIIGSFGSGSGELTVIGNVGAGRLRVAGRLVIRGQFTGGSLLVDWSSTLALYGDNPHAFSADVAGSKLLVQGSQPNLNVRLLLEMETPTGGSLSGDGLVGDVTDPGGLGGITPDSTLSVKNLSVRRLNINLNGTNVGEYGRLIASGDVSLSTGRLLPSAGFNPQAGQVYTIVEKTSPGPIANAFLGPEGTVTTLNGMPFRISYVGGDGNDVTLTAQPTNAVPIVTWQQPANNAAFPPGFAISLRARATDSDGTVSDVDFFATPTNGPAINVGQGTLASDGYYIRGWTNPPPGQYQLHAEAVDNVGGRGISDSVQIVVVGTNQPPANAQTRTWTGADPSGYWSAPANWSPAGVLVNGDALVFPGGLPPGDKVSSNDLTDRIFRSISFQAGGHTIRGNPITLTNRSECIINNGTNVIACDLTFTGTPSTPNYQFPSIRGFAGELTVIGNVGGSSLYVFLERMVIRGQFTGGGLRVQYGSLALYGDNPHAVSVEVYATSYGTLRVQGSQPNLNITRLREMESAECPSVSGDGVVGDVMGCGSITPDPTLSVKNASGRLDIQLNGTNVGEYGRLIASGNLSLSGRLLPSAGFNPQAGQVFTIVEKTSPGVISNAIFGLEGTITTLNGMPFRISYVGGDGNDVTLTATDTPPTVTITNPPNDAVFEPPASFTLGAAAGGSVTNVQFFLDATSLGNDTSSPYSVPVSGLVLGNYTLTAVASDDTGRHATNSIAITVRTRREWDVSRDFSLTANPGGPWSYGYMNVLGDAFSLLTYSQYAPDNNGLMIFLWSKNSFEPVAVFKNQTSQTSISDGGAGNFPPGTVWFSGGIEGRVDNYGVIRFTVPADKAGTYRVETAVRTYLDGAASRDADFWVLRNGTQVFSHFLGPNSGTGYTNIFTLAAGDTIDFVCGRGQDNMIHGSGLKIRATLTRTPVPIVLGAMQRSFGTQSVFSYSADVGLRYAVERSATLSNWTTIWSNTATVNPMTFNDTAATNGMNFYRVRLLPNP